MFVLNVATLIDMTMIMNSLIFFMKIDVDLYESLYVIDSIIL